MTNSQDNRSDQLFLGLDVGGTDVKIGLVDFDGRVLARDRTPTPQLRTPRRVFEYAVQFARQRVKASGRKTEDLVAVGLAVPGVLDLQSYQLREVVNLPGWLGVPLRDELIASANLPAGIVNDANSAALAEHAARGLKHQSLALVTLGTGIGCGVVVSGLPHGGDHGCAGELGHIAIDFGHDAIPCTCGSRGHLESYAGAGGVIKRLRRAIEDSDLAVPEELRDPDVTPRVIADCAEAGNELCQAIIDDTADYVGRAIGLMGQVADPEVVLLGGAMTFGGRQTKMGDRFLAKVRETVKSTTLVQVGGNMKIEFATLGSDAGMLGAAMVARQAAANGK